MDGVVGPDEHDGQIHVETSHPAELALEHIEHAGPADCHHAELDGDTNADRRPYRKRLLGL
jgi:hypothetical protein